MAWKSAAGSKEDVATGCNAEHEQVNRHPEHQRERPEGQTDTPKNRREQFGLSPCLPGPLPRSEHVEGSRARAAVGGVHRRPGGRALGAGLPGAYTSSLLIPVKTKGPPWATVHGAAHAHWGVYT